MRVVINISGYAERSVLNQPFKYANELRSNHLSVRPLVFCGDGKMCATEILYSLPRDIFFLVSSTSEWTTRIFRNDVRSVRLYFSVSYK